MTLRTSCAVFATVLTRVKQSAAQCVLAAIISVLCMTNAKAVPITYTETATVSGSIQAGILVLLFNNTLLTLTGTGDTTNIETPDSTHFFNNVTLSFSVAGSSGTFTNPTSVFSNQNTLVVGFTDETVGTDILDTSSAAFASYALSTSIGPITGSSAISTGASFPTSVGTLTLSSAGDATFTAVVTPLPAALPLFVTGLGALGLLGWRRKKKAAALAP